MSREWDLGGSGDDSDRTRDGRDELFGPPPEPDAPTPSGDWMFGNGEQQRLINRRWRKPKPGALHPRRRADDRQPSTATEEPVDPFDPSTLFESTSTAGPGPSRQSSVGEVVEPWATLQLTSHATWNDVVARHRELAKMFHPDRAGDDPAATRAAAERMASINAAFAELGKIYRLSGDR